MKKLRFAFFFACMAAMLMIPAAAYVDPSVTSMAIQAVAGVVVVVVAVVGVWWSKAKKKAKQVLNIDDNAGKTVEDDIVVFDEKDTPAAEETGADKAE